MSKVLYVQVAEKIMMNILEDEYKPGDKYKSVREIAMEFSVNPKTVQRAFDHLNDIGIFETVVGGGRYLSKDKDVMDIIYKHLILSEIQRFISQMEFLNITRSQLITYIDNFYDTNEN